MKKRLISIDNLKGLLTLVVIFGHVTVGLEGLAYGVYTIASPIQKISTIIYSFHMPLFFSLSGFFWKEKGKISVEERLSIIKNKLLALAVPYFLCSTVYFLIKYAMSRFTMVDLGWNSLIEIPIRPIEFFWYLYSLCTISILAEILDAIGVRKKIVLVLLAIVAMGNFVNTDFMALYKTAENAVYFYVGSVVYDYKEHLTKLKSIGIFATITVVFSWIYLNIYEAYNTVFRFWLCISIICFTIGLAMKLMEREIKYITYIGKNSMPFYVIHVIFVGGIRIILYRMGVMDTTLHIVVGFLLTTAVTYMLYRYIFSKIKWMDFMFYPLNYIKKDYKKVA